MGTRIYGIVGSEEDSWNKEMVSIDRGIANNKTIKKQNTSLESIIKKIVRFTKERGLIESGGQSTEYGQSTKSACGLDPSVSGFTAVPFSFLSLHLTYPRTSFCSSLWCLSLYDVLGLIYLRDITPRLSFPESFPADGLAHFFQYLFL
jgi:hypothetical protein